MLRARFVSFLLFTTLIAGSVLAQNAPQAPMLTLANMIAEESSNAFSIKVNVSAPGNSGDDDYYDSARNPGTQFDAIKLYDYVKVKPATKFSISAKRNGFILIGDFKPETKYSITLKTGLPSLDGKVLAGDETRELKTGSFRPRFTFKTKSRYLPAAMSTSLAWEAVNVKNVKFTIRQVPPQNIHHWLTAGESANSYVSDEIKSFKQTVKAKANALASGNVSLADLNALGQGVFVVEATRDQEKEETRQDSAEMVEGEDEISYNPSGYFRDQAIVVVTNLTVVSKMSESSGRVWVANTKDLSAVKGARVELISLSNRSLASCETSGSTAECSLQWKKDEKQQPYALLVKSGKDQTYVRFDDLRLSNDHLHAGKRSYSNGVGDLDGFIYAERDLYRPGETVHLAAMVRNSKFEGVAKLPLRWTITSPRGKVVREAVTDTSPLGLATLDFKTNAASDTGKYVVAALSGKTVIHEIPVLVEEFVPERIGVKVKPNQEFVVGKSAATFAIDAKYLFGPPVAGGTFNAGCTMKAAFNRIPTRNDYWTGIYSNQPKQSISLAAVEGKLDAKGLGSVGCDWAQAAGTKLAEVYELRAKVAVSEAGSGRASTKTGTALVASTDALIGLKHDGNKGRAVSIKGGLFDFKGGLQKKAASLKLHLFQIRRNWYYSYDGSGDNWKADEIITPTGVEKVVNVTDGTFQAALDAPDGWGEWLVRAVDTKTGYTADINVGYIGWYYDENSRQAGRAAEPDQLKVELTKTEVSPGATVQAMVTAPFKGRLLFTLESDRVLETKWIDVKAPGAVTVDFKIPNVLPNVYVTALLMKDPQDGKRFIPGRAWGARSLKVIPDAHRMTVTAKHPEISESRKNVTITLTNDQSEATEYSVAVVDEGILQMTDYESPDPLKRFFESRTLGVTTTETLGWTVAMQGDGKKPGGDEKGQGGTQNMPVKLVSFWYPSIKSDSRGKAELTVPVPPFQGKLRVIAVAGAKSRMGSSSTFMTVRDPLVLQPTLPRFMTNGDRLQFPVTVTNMSGKEQTINVVVEPGPLVTLAKATQSATIADGKATTLQFDAEVKGVVGVARIGVKASSSDGKLVSVDSFNIPVKPAGVEQTLRLSYGATQEMDLAKDLPSDWRPEYVRIEASVSNLPYLNQLSHLEQLIHYPYGCIEQTTSSTMPLLTIGPLLKWIDSKKKDVNLKNMVSAGINRILSMQTAAGGFAYWPGSNEPDPWGTAYATHMLLDAKKLGYEVPQTSLNSALTYLENFARNTGYKVASGYHHVSAEPFALYVLAKGGRPVAQELRETAKRAQPVGWNKPGYKWDGIAAENVFLLAAAARLAGDKETLKILADETTYSIQLTGARDDQYTYWSPLRADGLRLSVLLDVMPNHQGVDLLSARLASQLANNKSWYSTQDLAWAVLALGKRIQGMKRADPALVGKAALNVNGTRLAKAYDVEGLPAFVTEGSGLTKGKIGLVDVPGDKGLNLYVKATGYTRDVPASNSGLKITRRYLARDSKAVDLQAIKQGETVIVLVQVQNVAKTKVSNVAIVDRLPAGFEIENSRLGKSEDLQWMTDPYEAEYQDMRDDRLQVFGDLNPGQIASIYYTVRAVTKGTYTAPASFVEAMYDPANFDYDRNESIRIVDAAPAKK